MIDGLATYFLHTAVNRSCRKALSGRLKDVIDAEKGRFGKREIREVINGINESTKEFRRKFDVYKYKNIGSRQTVLLAMYMISAHRSLVKSGAPTDYATELTSDIGWLVYKKLINMPVFIARTLFKDPSKQMNFILGILQKYPYGNTPGDKPGYRTRYWKKGDVIHTNWYECPPHDFVREACDIEELDVFYNTFCQIEHAMAKDMVPACKMSRNCCMVSGDTTCNLKWVVESRKTVNESSEV